MGNLCSVAVAVAVAMAQNVVAAAAREQYRYSCFHTHDDFHSERHESCWGQHQFS